MEVGAYLTGIHARSRELISARKHNNGVEEAHRRDAESLVALQQASGIERLVDGMLSWNSPIEPVASCLEGVEVPATNLRRWFNTNTFFHMPSVTGRIAYMPGSIREHVAAGVLPKKGWKAVLPAPYTFASLVDNKHYEDFNELMFDFARAQREMVRELIGEGCAYVQLDDPSLVYHPLRDSSSIKDVLPEIKNAVELVTRGQYARFSLHTYFEDASPILRDVFDFPVQDIGIDFTETDLKAISGWDSSKGIALGIVDARSSWMEEPARIAELARSILDKSGAKEAYLCPTTSLKYLPRELADQKVRVISETARRLGSGS